MSPNPPRDPGRRTPAKGVHIAFDQPNWVILTVCTEKRSPWLAQPIVQSALHKIWAEQATAWLVSDYVLMPDHLHLFCAAHDLNCSVEKWTGFWKAHSVRALPGYGRFQAGCFHHRMRDGENYAEKWQYARENPVRKGLVRKAEEWRYWGRVHEIRWS